MTSSHGRGSGDRQARHALAVNRRRLMQAAGTLALGTSLAGCLGDGVGGEESLGERPAYSRWIGSTHLETARAERDGFLFVRTGFDELRELQNAEETFEGFGDDAVDSDAVQLVVAPFYGTIAFTLLASFGLVAYGGVASQILGSMQAGMEESGTESESSPAHTIDVGLLVGRLVVFEGDFDVDAIDAAAGSFERSAEYEGFQIYEGTESSGSTIRTSDLAFAVGEGAVLFPVPTSNLEGSEGWRSLESVQILKSHLDVAAGSSQEAADGNEGFDWVLRAGGGGTFVLVGHGLVDADVDRVEESPTEEPELDHIEPLLEDAESFALSTAFDVADSSILAEGGFAYAEESSRPEEAGFESLVEGATTSSVEVRGSRARVEAAWIPGDAGSSTPSG